MEAMKGKIQEALSLAVRPRMDQARRPVTPSCLGEPVAVIQGSHVDALLPQLLPLLLVRSSSLRGLPRLRYSLRGSTLPQL